MRHNALDVNRPRATRGQAIASPKKRARKAANKLQLKLEAEDLGVSPMEFQRRKFAEVEGIRRNGLRPETKMAASEGVEGLQYSNRMMSALARRANGQPSIDRYAF